MDYRQFLESNRKIRSKLLGPAGKFLLKLKLTANHLTFFSLFLGLTAVYFLFQNHLLFIIFAALHLTMDGLDGVLARLTKTTQPGKYFDYFTDQTITFLLLLRIYFYLQDYYVILIMFLFILGQTVYVLSQLEYPVIFFRTGGFILLGFTPLFPIKLFLTFSYLVAGVISLFTLLLQFKYFLKNKISLKN